MGRIRIRISTVWLAMALLALLAVWYVAKDNLREAHLDDTIYYFASDAPVYLNAYEVLYADATLAERPELFLVGSPILFMKLAGGNLSIVLFCQLLLMAISLRVGCNCFRMQRGRNAFMLGAFVFPYFLFGFVSLNKEVFAMCSAIFFSSYMIRGKWAHAVIALVLAMCARYYMLAALLSLFFFVPRTREPRLGWVVATLLAISIMAPIAKNLIPQYSSEGLLDAPGFAGILFSQVIDSFGYIVIYPIKYLALIPLRAYSYVIDPTRLANAMEGWVSIMTFAVLIPSLLLLRHKRKVDPIVRRLIIAALVAPVLLMWSEIMHWRYYSFVYFFLLFALVLHYRDHPAKQRVPADGLSHA